MEVRTGFKVPLTYKKGGIDKYAKPESERPINKLRAQWGGEWIEMIANMWHKSIYGTPLFRNSGFENRQNYSYHGDVFMGSNMQQFSVVWDTGSGAYIANSMGYSGWEEVSSKAFDTTTSDTHRWKVPEET